MEKHTMCSFDSCSSCGCCKIIYIVSDVLFSLLSSSVSIHFAHCIISTSHCTIPSNMRYSLAFASALAGSAVAAPASSSSASSTTASNVTTTTSLDYAAIVNAPYSTGTPEGLFYTESETSSESTSSAAPSTTSSASVNQKSTPEGLFYTASTTASTTFLTAASPSASAIAKRALNDPCAPQPDGFGPMPATDSVTAFQDPAFPADTLRNAHIPFYSRVGFSALPGAVNTQTSYLNLFTLSSYNTTRCQEICDAYPSCSAINIYLERDPSLNPNITAGCPNPPSITNVKCTLYNETLTPAMAVNTGQTRGNFQVVITASNAYNRAPVPATPAGYVAPLVLRGDLQLPTSQQPHYTGQYDQIPNDQAANQNVQYCATRCAAITSSNRAAAISGGQSTYQPCNYFTSSFITLNDGIDSFFCVYYDTTLGIQYATDLGHIDDIGRWRSYLDSYGWTASTIDPGTV